MATIDSWEINALIGRKTRFVADEATAGAAWTARNGCFPIVIKYIGSLAVATVEAASDVIEFNHGATYGAIAVDETDWTSGTIDTSAGAYNTYGELVDAINASTNWRAYLLDTYRSKTCILKDLTVAEDNTSLATQLSGVGLLEDGAGAADELWCGLRNVDLRGAFPTGVINAGTMDARYACLLYGCQLDIDATGSPVFIILDLDDANNTKDVIYQPVVLTDNTAAAFDFNYLMGAPIYVKPGHRILVGADISTIVTGSYIAVQGSVFIP